MKRLTIRISGYAHGAEGVSTDKLTGSYHRGEFEATACVEKLAEYEDLEEQGRLLKLPCAVGDTVYEVQALRERIQPYTIREIHISNFENQYSWELKDGKGFYSNVDGFSESDLGDSVFLTMEEAEAALACSILSQNQQCEECICNSCTYKEDCCPDCEGAILGCEEYLEADGDKQKMEAKGLEPLTSR